MPLVANYSSGSESDSDSEPQQTPKTQRSFTDSLPAPKRKLETANGKVQIFVDLPKLSNDKDHDNELKDSAPVSKRPKTSGGSGLSALLPPPKNPNASLRKEGSTSSTTPTKAPTSTTTSFIPPALAKRKAELAAKSSTSTTVDNSKLNILKKTTVEPVDSEDEKDENESDNEDDGGVKSFFPLGPNITQVLTTPTQSQPATTTEPVVAETNQPTEAEGSDISYTAADAYAYYDPNTQYDPAAYQQWYQQQAAYAQYEEHNQNWNAPEEELSSEAMERLMGRHGRGLGENINIKTVNLAEELQNKDGIPTQEPVGLSGSSIKTSSLQKRKSNIMFLAHQAQSRRDILAEQYAQNRKTKREAKMKYGF